MTTKEYRALGYQTLSPARLQQLMSTPVSQGKTKHYFGKEHWNYKGGYLSGVGYKILNVDGKKGVYEHRYLVEQSLGRKLESNEVVHHKDGNRANNSLDNLEVMTCQEHDKMKDGTRAYFHTGKECEEAAETLLSLGWPKAKIQRALRIHHSTLARWIKRLIQK
jgi:hypothetical protein